MIRRRTLLRWGFRAGTTLAYFGDPELGPQRRDAVLAAIEPFGMKTRFGPVVAWLRNLNAGEIAPPPSREELRAAQAAARAAGVERPDDAPDARSSDPPRGDGDPEPAEAGDGEVEQRADGSVILDPEGVEGGDDPVDPVDEDASAGEPSVRELTVVEHHEA